MRPIEYRADIALTQALRCVEYRLPKTGQLKTPGYILSVGLRYGLMGAAAAYHLLLSSNDEDEAALISSLMNWDQMVAEHVRWEIRRRFMPNPGEEMAGYVGALALELLQIFLPLYRRLCPLELSLSIASEQYGQRHDDEVGIGWTWFSRRRGHREFKECADQSFRYALMFFERRQADVDEVPEIALLGE